MGSATDNIWKFFRGESLTATEDRIVKQAAEAPSPERQRAQLEYAKRLWQEELAAAKMSWAGFVSVSICWTVFLLILSIFIWSPDAVLANALDVLKIMTGIGFGLGFVFCQATVETRRRKFRREIESCNKALIASGVEALSEDKDFFTRLVTINFNYLDLYYGQTKDQANKSFWISVVAGVAGFGIIIAGICILVFKEGSSSGPITVASGVLGEFISGVFFYLYNRTILSMGQYHQKLVVTQNIGLALKTAEGLSEPQKSTAQVNVINELTKNVNVYLSEIKLATTGALPEDDSNKKQREKPDALTNEIDAVPTG
jgi:hypothetical protein